MKKLKIQAITKKGEDSLKQHYEETTKLNIRERLAWKLIGKQELVSKDPYILEVTLNGMRILKNPYFIDSIRYEIKITLEANNGAKQDIDYILEEINENETRN